MAQKKKKGPPPKSKEAKGKKVSPSQMIFYVVGILIVLSMIITTIRY